jgi:hypothetical protein
MNIDVTDTNGYSPEEMWVLVNDPFGERSPLQLKPIPEEVCEQIPLFRQVYRLLEILYTGGEIKLTQKGNLPMKVVTELSGFGIPDKITEDGYAFRSEVESVSVPVAREVARLIGAVKKRNNKLSITAKGERIFCDKPALAAAIVTAACTTFQAKIMDWIEGEELTGEAGVGYVLLLLNKYGVEECSAEHYYFSSMEAMPFLCSEPLDVFTFTSRMFESRLRHLGIVELTEHKIGTLETETRVKKTPLFDKLFLCRPPSLQIVKP